MKCKFAMILLCLSVWGDAIGQNDKINWMLFWEAQWKNNEDRKFSRESKKTFVFLYDEDNRWCRRMRQEVFMNDEITNYLTQNYFPVFWHVENYRKEVMYETNHTFNYEENEHDFVSVLTNSKMSYPYMVILDETFKIICRVPGFRKERDVLKALKIYNEK